MRIALIVLAILFNTQAAAQPMTPEDGNVELAEAAREARESTRGLTFEEFRDQTLFIEETGKYYVNGDTPIRNEKLLREFWLLNVANEPIQPQSEVDEFAVLNIGGLDQIWQENARHSLTYCVSTEFGFRHSAVVADLEGAAAALEAVADIDFHYIASHDAYCDQFNPSVLFDVRPVDADGQFLAAAFFPNDPRQYRSIVIDPSSFQIDPNDALTLRGILRHELGHVIGGRHEHTRPEAGACFEDADWRGVTDYDAFSFMHYPQCNGKGDWSLRLTKKDQSGIACLYGAAIGVEIDTSNCNDTVGEEHRETTTSFDAVDVAQNEIVQLGSVSVTPGTRIIITMTGSGDPDIYMKVNRPPALANYDCRPFTAGANETCDRDIPENGTNVNIMVHGFQIGTAEVSVRHTPR